LYEIVCICIILEHYFIQLLSSLPSPSPEKVIELPRILNPDAHFSPDMREYDFRKVFYYWTPREEFLNRHSIFFFHDLMRSPHGIQIIVMRYQDVAASRLLHSVS
jgi:hypothetical protein